MKNQVFEKRFTVSENALNQAANNLGCFFFRMTAQDKVLLEIALRQAEEGHYSNQSYERRKQGISETFARQKQRGNEGGGRNDRSGVKECKC